MLDTLLRGDKMSMASSLEMRAPLLMTELVEFLQTVPEKYLVDGNRGFMHDTKILLKSLCSDIYGEDFTYRYKIGLGVPIHEIFKDSDVRKYVEENLLPKVKSRGVVNYDYVYAIWEQSTDIDNCLDTRLEVLWTVFSFEIWSQMYLDNSPLSSIQKS